MAKTSKKYLEYGDYSIEEIGFHPDRSQVSESLFALSNERMGVRASFEEGYSGATEPGTFYNGLYDYALSETGGGYKGVVKRTHYMVKAPDFWSMRIFASGAPLDLGFCPVRDFRRKLDFLSGEYTRSFTWERPAGAISFAFSRFLSMDEPDLAFWRFELSAEKATPIRLVFSLDGDVRSWGSVRHFKTEYLDAVDSDLLLGAWTAVTDMGAACASRLEAPADLPVSVSTSRDQALQIIEFIAEPGRVYRFGRTAATRVLEAGEKLKPAELRQRLDGADYESHLAANRRHFEAFFRANDIEIDGDPDNQQGIRFCLFQLHQTYRGLSPRDNIGAKGLTGEAYSGHTFWDTETFCLPYFLFGDPDAARNLLLYRYRTLEAARARARDLDCGGACFPIATLNGEEACSLWQHASLQLQASTGVVYGIYHYVRVTGDEQFLLEAGYEMVLEVARFLLDRGQYSADGRRFGYYCVMGPDEFQLMVNHNTYTNYLAKFVFDYLLELSADPRFAALGQKFGATEEFFTAIRAASDAMVILEDEASGLYEQHQGYYDLPHIAVDQIPSEDFPLYSHWTYDRIYRNDMIKQPDVLMFMFLFLSRFDREQLEVNYRFYEPRCIHESSLSPSVHSVIAARIGAKDDARRFFQFATRLDLDDYNNNTSEGLHVTSIAAAYVNIIYGFAGLTSDGESISLNPDLPSGWERYSFHLRYRGADLKIEVRPQLIAIANSSDQPASIVLAGEPVEIAAHSTLERPRC